MVVLCLFLPAVRGCQQDRPFFAGISISTVGVGLIVLIKQIADIERIPPAFGLIADLGIGYHHAAQSDGIGGKVSRPNIPYACAKAQTFELLARYGVISPQGSALAGHAGSAQAHLRSVSASGGFGVQQGIRSCKIKILKGCIGFQL